MIQAYYLISLTHEAILLDELCPVGHPLLYFLFSLTKFVLQCTLSVRRDLRSVCGSLGDIAENIEICEVPKPTEDILKIACRAAPHEW